jgi:hypothetical protein
VEKESGEVTDLRTMVLKRLEQGPLDVFALREDLNVDFDRLAKELSILLEADYISKINSLFLFNRQRKTIFKS